DALLEAQLRHFLRSEFGVAEPPPNVFTRLLVAIRSDFPATNTYRSRLFVAIAQLGRSTGRALTGHIAARILPAGAALLLMVALLGTNMPHILNGQIDDLHATISSVATHEAPNGFLL